MAATSSAYNLTTEFYFNVTNLTCLGMNNCTKNPSGPRHLAYILVTCYSIICVLGLLGNGLVIYVVVRYAKMKTVTNMYILNLAVADVSFLLGLPFLIATTILEHWVFGYAMCKLFFVVYSINWFTGVFTLTLMSADRYLAVCYPVKSVRYRTPKIARLVCFCIWSASFLVMLPIVLYANSVDSESTGRHTCTITWPENQFISSEKAFTWYSLLLGFAIPVPLISVFYILVVIRLRTVGPVKRSREKKKSHRKVTRMVLAVILVYVFCWLPYWVFQVNLSLSPKNQGISNWKKFLFNGFTVLSYANSMLNPVLYAFLSENFRKSFAKAFKCTPTGDVSRALFNETSAYARTNNVDSQHHREPSRDMTNVTESFELTSAVCAPASVASCRCDSHLSPKIVNIVNAKKINNNLMDE